MSQHPSYGGESATARHRSVLKRYEKLQSLKTKGDWNEEDGIYGLPKIKVVKIRAKKKKTEEEGAEGAEGAAPANGADAKKEAAKK